MPKPVDVRIDRETPVPLYHQLAEQLSAAIASGQLQPGDAFENEVAMAGRLGLSRPTVRRAIQELVGQGLLLRRRGLGTTVAGRQIHRRAELTSLYDDLRREGSGDPRTVVLTHEVTTDEVAATPLGLPADTPLLKLVRLRFDGDRPLAILRNWLPPDYSDISREDLEHEGLYALLRARGGKPVVAHRAQAPRPDPLPAGPDDVTHGVRRHRWPRRVRRPLLPRPGLLHRGHARRALTAPASARRPTTEKVCRVDPFAPPRPPGAAPSVALVRPEPALGRAGDRVDRLALRRVVAGLDDTAGRGRRVADPGLGRCLRRHVLDRESTSSGLRPRRGSRRRRRLRRDAPPPAPGGRPARDRGGQARAGREAHRARCS